jgi:hypothetical protein
VVHLGACIDRTVGCVRRTSDAICCFEKELNVMQVVKAVVLYFVLVFGAGFVLGTIRTLWVVPLFGTRMAELMEMSLMLAVTMRV